MTYTTEDLERMRLSLGLTVNLPKNVYDAVKLISPMIIEIGCGKFDEAEEVFY